MTTIWPPIEDNWVTREFFKDRLPDDYRQQFFIGMDFGSAESETRYDPNTGTYKIIGPEEIEKRRRWYELRARVDAKFAAENPGVEDMSDIPKSELTVA